MKFESIENADMGKLTALINGSLEHDHLPRAALAHGILNDRHYEPVLNTVAFVDGEPAGMLAGVFRPESEVANIKLIAVREDMRRRGIAAALMDDFEAKAVARNAVKITIGYEGALYFFCGIDPRYTTAMVMLLKRGYEVAGNGFFMEADLRKPVPSSADIEARLVKEGVAFQRAAPDEREEVAEWIRTNFSEGWAHESLLVYDNDPINLWTARRDGAIIGFAAYCATSWNYFGPTGVAEEFRGRGVGSVLLTRSLIDMQREGIISAWIPTGVHRISFYHRAAGARVGRLFWRMSKQLREEADEQ